MLSLALGGGAQTPAQGGGACAITYVANAGVLFETDGQKFLFDAPIREGISPYATPTMEQRRSLESATAPFDNVTAILITHWHEDHFSAEAVAAHLRSSPSTRLVSSAEVVQRVKAVAGPAVPAAQFNAVTPEPGASERATGSGVPVHVLRIRHNPTRRLPEQHVGFLVEGCRTVLHTGDADPKADNFSLLRSLPPVDTALLPFWYVMDDSNRRFVTSSIGAAAHPRHAPAAVRRCRHDKTALGNEGAHAADIGRHAGSAEVTFLIALLDKICRFFLLSRREFLVLAVLFLLSLPAVTARLYSSDEVQYFSYLRSIWFDRDVSFENEYRYFYDHNIAQSGGYYETFLVRETGAGRRVNYGTIGCALLWSPFYGIAASVDACHRGCRGWILTAIHPRGGLRVGVLRIARCSAVDPGRTFLLTVGEAGSWQLLAGAGSAGFLAGVGVGLVLRCSFTCMLRHRSRTRCRRSVWRCLSTVWLHVRREWSVSGTFCSESARPCSR